MADRLGQILADTADEELGDVGLAHPGTRRATPEVDSDGRSRGGRWLLAAAAVVVLVAGTVAVLAARDDAVRVDTPATPPPEGPGEAPTDTDAAAEVRAAAEATMASPWRGTIVTDLEGIHRVTSVPEQGSRFDADVVGGRATIVTRPGRFTGAGSLEHGAWDFDPDYVPGAGDDSAFDPAFLLPLLMKQLTDLEEVEAGDPSERARVVAAELAPDECQSYAWAPVVGPCRLEVLVDDGRVAGAEVFRDSEPGGPTSLVRLDIGPAEPGLAIEEPGPSGNWPGLGAPLEIGSYTAGTPTGDVPGLTEALDFLEVPFDDQPLAEPSDQCWVDIPSAGQLGACLMPAPEGGYVLRRLAYFAGELGDPDKGLAEQGPGHSAQGSRVEISCTDRPGELLVRFGDEERTAATDGGGPMCGVDIDRSSDEAGWVILRTRARADAGDWDQVHAFMLPPGDTGAG